MHKSARHFGELFFSTYNFSPAPLILDVGSLDVNGSLRDLAPDDGCYIGADLGLGPGVDVVLPKQGLLPFRDGCFDVTVSTSCFEHDWAFWATFEEIARVTAPSGLIYVNAPMNGEYHRYPLDCWRFYPDAGLGLANWATRQGFEVSLLESFIGPREDDQWNDCVMVFSRGPARPGPRITDDFISAMNVHRPDRSPEVANLVAPTEDQRLLAAATVSRGGELLNGARHAYGWVDTLLPTSAAGWVASPKLDRPAIVLAFLDDIIIGTAIADGTRPDLAAAGHLQAGFSMHLRVSIPPNGIRKRLRFEAMLDGASLGAVSLTPEVAERWAGVTLQGDVP